MIPIRHIWIFVKKKQFRNKVKRNTSFVKRTQLLPNQWKARSGKELFFNTLFYLQSPRFTRKKTALRANAARPFWRKKVTIVSFELDFRGRQVHIRAGNGPAPSPGTIEGSLLQKTGWVDAQRASNNFFRLISAKKSIILDCWVLRNPRTAHYGR